MKTSAAISLHAHRAVMRRTTPSAIRLSRAKSVLFATTATLLTGISLRTNAALPPPLPEANPAVPRIVEILPPEATVGQTIIVRLESTTATSTKSTTTTTSFFGSSLTTSTNPLSPLTPELKLSTRDYFSGALTVPPKIYFCGKIYPGPRVPGLNVTALGSNRYSVVVPENAVSGKLRFETSAGNSYSTVNIAVVGTGYSVVNFSQFDIVSIKVDNVERLPGMEVPATLPTNPDVFVADVGATAGNHSMQITLGPSARQPVITYFLPSVNATNPFTNIEVGIMGVGEYFVASPNATVSGNNITASWQTLFINPDTTLLVNGFDFTHNIATGETTWANWNFDRSEIVASGTVIEPSDWELNQTFLVLELRSNGQHYTDLIIDFLDKSFVADDQFTYVLQ